MQSLKKLNSLVTLPLINSLSKICSSNIHSSSNLSAYKHIKTNNISKFLKHNDTIFPPQESHEERRPAFVCHEKRNIKYSPQKMWYVASLIRGLTIDEAIKQLNFVLKKGSGEVKTILLEAKALAVEKHNVEFGSNLWVAESFVGKGKVIKGMRRHAKQRLGEVRYTYCNYFVRLEEGTPPANYYCREVLTPPEQLDKWLDGMRKRKIIGSI